MQTCPKCQSQKVHRSRSRGKWEEWRRHITGKRLYRCPDCQWRGWALDSGPHFSDVDRTAAERALAPEPPNLQGTELARTKTAEPPDLKKLDSFTEPQG
jgi:predicted RNA-binding Zn-ribbon protein involved in translation (DUF1610 family)